MVTSRRMVGLLLLAMAAALLASAINVPDAGAKKKKVNVVQCADVGFVCNGTNGKDRLVGTNSNNVFQGFEGNDTYTGNVGGFGSDSIFDVGGGSDLLDLSSFRSEDFAFSLDEDPTDVILDGPGSNSIEIDGQFSGRKIEKIKFADRTIKGKEIKDLVGEATAEVQAILDERPPEDGRSTQGKE